MSKKESVLAEGISEALFEFAEYDEGESEKTGYSNYSYWQATFHVFLKNKTAVGICLLLIMLVGFTLIQPYLPNQKSPTQIYLNPETGMHYRNLGPNSEFWFGTNSIGQDLWARIWSGTRTSLLLGLSVAVCDGFLGLLMGAVWGYARRLDGLLTGIYNVLDNIPQTIILVLLSYILRPGLTTMLLAMCAISWLGTARFIRNQILIIRDREYNLASRCLGTPPHRILFKNLLPYLVSVIMLRMALSIPTAIGSEVFLTYIGLGMPVSIPSLGNLVNEGRGLMMVPDLRYQLIFPAIVISIITVSFYVLGNAFADAADPRSHV